ncbi:hypothetical protein CHS0354_030145 [Potamilus streckersoni]|uniref:TIR domain-containing protein n=1 Tax=Potamilus streckersoni TaxID=2493646 RepID=A0AAE0W147_9BIVA|nr:hypothetical protein CHS0354_030145 [Potamilus streckersoni]
MDVNVTIDEPLLDNVHSSRQTVSLPPGKKFHIYFAYRDVLKDKLWVKRVVKKLETEYGYICCDHERDFLPGTKIMDNIKDGVMNSEKVVVVFSKEAIDSYYVLLEAAMAYQQSIENRKNLLIPVLLDDCAVPKEYMLLTYIDATKEVEETTWWHKLMKSIKSTEQASRSPFQVEGNNVAAGKTFAITQLCSIETKYSFIRCSMQTNKYIPKELRPESCGVPSDLIRAINKDLLRSAEIECRQKCCCFARLVEWFGYIIIFFFFFYLIHGIVCFIRPEIAEKSRHDCTPFIIACSILFIIFGLCYFACKRFYAKVPAELLLSTYEDLLHCPRVLRKPTCRWFAILLLYFPYLTAAVFLYCTMVWMFCFTRPEIAEATRTDCLPSIGACIFLFCIYGFYYFACKRFFVKMPCSVLDDIICYNKMLSKYGVMVTVVPRCIWKSASLIFYKCQFELCKEYVIRHLVKEGSTHTTEHRCILDSRQMTASAEGSLFVSGVGKPARSREQSIPIVTSINPVMAEEDEDVSDVTDDKPLLSNNQKKESENYEKKALELLMSCTPEYLNDAYADKLKKPKEDRHGIEILCLCQYLEKVDKVFQEKVKRTKSLRLKTGIEENYQDETNAHFKNILLD